MDKTIKEAVGILKQGGIVIFPTDTAFGIGCAINDEKAVERLFKIRKRPLTQATPVLVDSIEMASDYVESIPNAVKKQLIGKYWPGALTIILKSKNKISKMVQGGGDTLGVRMPDHKIALKLIQEVGVPILGPSANFHGEKTPYRFEDLDPKLIKLVDYVFQGHPLQGLAFLPSPSPSTVIDCSVKPWKIVREGAISLPVIPNLFRDPGSKKILKPIRQAQGGQVQDDNFINELFIDTSSNEIIKVGLRISNKKYEIKRRVGIKKAQAALPLIDKLLKKHKLALKDINGIKVNTGPGSFTGIRVGVAITNALSFALKIPRY